MFHQVALTFHPTPPKVPSTKSPSKSPHKPIRIDFPQHDDQKALPHPVFNQIISLQTLLGDSKDLVNNRPKVPKFVRQMTEKFFSRVGHIGRTKKIEENLQQPNQTAESFKELSIMDPDQEANNGREQNAVYGYGNKFEQSTKYREEFEKGFSPDFNSKRKTSKSCEKISLREVTQVKAKYAKVMDKSKEKFLVEKRRKLDPKIQEIHHISDEFVKLRKLTHELASIPNEILTEKNRSSSISPGCKRRINLNRINSENTNRNGVYFMNSEYTPTKTTSKIDFSSTLSRMQSYQPQQTNISDNLTPLRERSAEKFHFTDPFDKEVIYQDKKMPFSLALTAKTRQSLFEEVKRRDQKSSYGPNTILNLRNKLIPEEKAKFLENLDQLEKEKKHKELKSRDGYSNAITQAFALDHVTKRKLRAKFEENFAPNSRFLELSKRK